MSKISTLQNENNNDNNNNLHININTLSSPTTNGGCNGGETPDPDDDDVAIAQNFNFNHFDPSCTVFEIVDSFKEEKQDLLNLNDKLREELFDKNMEIKQLNEQNSKLEGVAMEWRQNMRMKLNKIKHFRLN